MVLPLVMAGVSLLGGIGAASAEKSIASRNARTARHAARHARRRGVEDVNRLRMQARALMGQQTTGLAAQNVQVDAGVALDIAASTAHVTELDAITLMNNAALEAWNHKTNAELGRFAAKERALGHILGGVGGALEGIGGYLGSGGG